MGAIGVAGAFCLAANFAESTLISPLLWAVCSAPFGIDIQVTGLRTVGNNGGGTTGVVTFGGFVQSTPKGTVHTGHSNGEIKLHSANFAAKQNASATPIAPMPAAEGPKPTNDNLT